MKVHNACVVVVLALTPIATEAATITVCPSGCDETSIQTAHDVATPGDTVFIYPGTYSEPSPIYLSKSITIRGSGPGVTFVDGQGVRRVFIFGINLAPYQYAALEDMTIINGSPDGIHHWAQIYTNTIEIRNCVINSNGSGRGIFIDAYYATTDVMTLIIDSSVVMNGFNPSSGGGLHLLAGNTELINSVVIDNEAAEAGGINVGVDAILAIINSTITSNLASSGDAGGIKNDGDLDVSFSTVANNQSSTGYGMGIRNNTITATLTANIISNPGGHNCGGLYTSGGYNIDDDDTCELNGIGDIGGQPAGLGPFIDTGDYRSHFPLFSGSVAVDHADLATFPADDQLGEPRPQDGDGNGVAVCNSGAIEGVEGLFADGFETGDTSAWSLTAP